MESGPVVGLDVFTFGAGLGKVKDCLKCCSRKTQSANKRKVVVYILPEPSVVPAYCMNM